MGNTLDKIDDGFYITGVGGLIDVDGLRSAGITHILNAAYMELYTNHPKKSSLTELPNLFKLMSLECDDCEEENLSVHFGAAADFIEQGRQQGGVVVHCAAGISRASTTSLAYLMMKTHLSLDAAFYKVHTARNGIHPNSGFWRQLRDLEAVLQTRCSLVPLDPDMRAFVDKSRKEGFALCTPGDAFAEFAQKLISLDASLDSMESFATHFLTARFQPNAGVSCSDLANHLRSRRTPGIVWQELVPNGDVLDARAKVVPSMNSATFMSLLAGIDGVQQVVCE